MDKEEILLGREKCGVEKLLVCLWTGGVQGPGAATDGQGRSRAEENTGTEE